MSKPLKTPRQSRSKTTWDAILDAATQLFSRSGYRGTTTNHVAEHAGVSIGTLYQYFPNKDALLFALAERHLHAVMNAMDAGFLKLERENPGLNESLEHMIDLVVELHRLDTAAHKIVFEHTLRSPQLSERLQQLDALITRKVADQLRRLGLDGGQADARALLMVQGMEAQIHNAILNPPSNIEFSDLVHELRVLWIGVVNAWSRTPGRN